ncbi:MAG: hypothetical protein GY946_01655 [bacterium]|nr:hypothetical protein [bacterium]
MHQKSGISGLLGGFVLVTSLWAAPSLAALTPDQRAHLSESGVVAGEVLEALERSESVVARIYFDLSGEQGLAVSAGSELQPEVAEITRFLLPGERSTSELVLSRAVTGTVDVYGLMGLLQNPRVFSIDLESSAAALMERETFVCIPSSTAACLSGRFRVQVKRGSTYSPVVSAGWESATFYFFSSSNWEVLVKVLNGCSVNSKYWVFAAGATTQSYTIEILDVATSATKTYGAQCPVADTTAFGCAL